MLKIKLMRFGRRNQPSYRIIVSEAKSKNKGQYRDCLGFYNPLMSPKILKINKKIYSDWLNKGAKPTEKVKKLVAQVK